MMRNKKLVLLTVLMLAVLLTGGFVYPTGGSDKVALFSNVTVPDGIFVDGSAVAIFGNVRIDGTVKQDVVAVFGNVTVNGTVEGDIVSVFGTSRINDKAVVKGEAVGVGGGVIRAPGSVVIGRVTDTRIADGINLFGILCVILFIFIISVLSVYCASSLITLLVPDRVKNMADESFNQVARRFGFGFVLHLLYIPVIIVLCITIIGIIVIPFFMTAFFIISFIGTTAMALALGRRLLKNVDRYKKATYIHLLAGVAVMLILLLIPVLGWLVYIVLTMIALGVAVDTRLGNPVVRK